MVKPILWQWQAIDPLGKSHRGISLAASKGLMRQKLRDSGHHLLRLSRHPRPGRQCWHIRYQIAFLRQLATLLQAGISLNDGLALLGRQHPLPAWQALLLFLREQINLGAPLSTAIRECQLFPALVSAMIHTGELTGQLDTCCQRLAHQQQQQYTLQKMIVKALRYPLFIMLVALLVTATMIGLVLPQFASIYQTFNAPLPAITQGLLDLANFSGTWGGPLLLLLCGGGGVCYRLYCRTPSLQLRLQRLLLALPLVAPLLQSHHLCIIFTTLSLTQRTGVPLLQGLEATEVSLPGPLWPGAITRVREQIHQGTAFSCALASDPLFPPMAVQLIATGEASGTLDIMLEYLAAEYGEQAMAKATGLSATLEPLMMLIMGGLIGSLVVAMYLPLFQLGEILN